MDTPAAYPACLSVFQSRDCFGSIELHEIHSSSDFTDQRRRVVGDILKAKSASSESGKSFGQRVHPCPLIRLQRPLFDPRIVQRVHKRRSVPVPPHRASRSARTAAATASRFSATSAPRKRPLIRRGFTTGAGTSCTRRMLPSGRTVASKVAFGLNNFALASLPCSSAVNFIVGLCHGNRRFSSYSCARAGLCPAVARQAGALLSYAALAGADEFQQVLYFGQGGQLGLNARQGAADRQALAEQNLIGMLERGLRLSRNAVALHADFIDRARLSRVAIGQHERGHVLHYLRASSDDGHFADPAELMDGGQPANHRVIFD